MPPEWPLSQDHQQQTQLLVGVYLLIKQQPYKDVSVVPLFLPGSAETGVEMTRTTTSLASSEGMMGRVGS